MKTLFDDDIKTIRYWLTAPVSGIHGFDSLFDLVCSFTRADVIEFDSPEVEREFDELSRMYEEMEGRG